jgi:hypothetical protein
MTHQGAASREGQRNMVIESQRNRGTDSETAKTPEEQRGRATWDQRARAGEIEGHINRGTEAQRDSGLPYVERDTNFTNNLEGQSFSLFWGNTRKARFWGRLVACDCNKRTRTPTP